MAARRGKACTHNIGHPLVARISNDTQKFLNAFTSDRRDNAKLGKVSADRIDHGGLLANEQMDRWRVRWSINPLCCSGVLVGANRMLALVTASQMASASAASFFCRLT